MKYLSQWDLKGFSLEQVLLYFLIITALHLIFLVLFKNWKRSDKTLSQMLILRDAALKINQSLMETEDTKSLLDMMILTAVSVINKGAQGTIMLSENGVMKVRSQVGFDPSIFDELQIPINETLIYKHTGGDLSRAVIMEGDKKWARDDLYLANIKSMMSAPIHSNGQLFATINLYSSAHNQFNLEDLITLEYLAEQVKMVLEKHTYYEETLKNAQMDSLTGLFNRRHTLVTIQRYLSQNQSHLENVSLLLLDINNLKPVNDHYGHDYGDHLIQGFASALLKVFSGAVCIGRYGGDEFLVCIDMPRSLPLCQTEALDAKLNEYLAQNPIRVANVNISIEYSLGEAFYSEAEGDLRQWIKLADQRMYKEKTRQKYQ